ncbi:MAG: RNA polymerase sigma-70 factor (ECF subfamily) [Gammaproteobacteria bacterium]|jgi:RNA polymerase sigma-70 factor (ECF subfamily)
MDVELMSCRNELVTLLLYLTPLRFDSLIEPRCRPDSWTQEHQHDATWLTGKTTTTTSSAGRRGWPLRTVGDKTAYKQLLSELAEVLEAYVRHRFGKLQLLEDCVQESLLAIHNARHTYDPARPFRPWMFTIIRHKTIDILRKSRQMTRNDGEIAADTMLNQSGHYESDPVEAMIDGARLLDRMEPDHRDAVAFSQYPGYSVPEAAGRLGISESALKGPTPSRLTGDEETIGS